ncbi:MAG: hypothetical protein HY741_10295 [Chloroflexi bacterium]|nr:hypothetical protein [Chloroflexota bacterium]
MNNLSLTLLIVGGFFNLGFGLFHLTFWRVFRWKEELASLSFINRGIVQVLNLCLTFVFFVLAYISFFHASELLSTKLGAALLTAIALFWFLRAVEQVIFFRLRRPVSLILTLVFLLGSALYLAPLILEF